MTTPSTQDPAQTHADAAAMAERVRAVLLHSGLDGTVFAAELGVPYSTMRSYLSGVRPPSTEFVTAAWRHFGIDTTWLLTGEGSMLPKPPVAAPATTAAIHAQEERPIYGGASSLRVAEPEESPPYLVGAPTPPTTVHQLTPLEAVLLQNYRAASAEGKEALRHMAAFSADYALKHRAT